MFRYIVCSLIAIISFTCTVVILSSCSERKATDFKSCYKQELYCVELNGSPEDFCHYELTQYEIDGSSYKNIVNEYWYYALGMYYTFSWKTGNDFDGCEVSVHTFPPILDVTGVRRDIIKETAILESRCNCLDNSSLNILN